MSARRAFALVDMLVQSDLEMKVALNQISAELTGLARARIRMTRAGRRSGRCKILSLASVKGPPFCRKPAQVVPSRWRATDLLESTSLWLTTNARPTFAAFAAELIGLDRGRSVPVRNPRVLAVVATPLE